jgi:tripartite-type tricarboxylate transporter receptor subunit TctC
MVKKVPIGKIRRLGYARLGSAACLAAALLVLIVHRPAAAQNYPAKSIKLVVPFGPGGPTDVAARLASLIIQSNLGQSVVIENRPGAGGALGTRSVASADPDGYTLLLGTVATLGALPAVTKNPGFDPVRSFAPVAKLTESTAVLVVPLQLSANTLPELIALAKANPGKLNYASAGVGNQTHLNAEVFRARAGIDIVHVPYKSGAEMVTAVLSNQVQISFTDISILLPLIKEGKVKPLAITGPGRHPALPEIPTLIESGIGHVATFWTGVVAPADTPLPVVNTLNASINSGLMTPGVRDTLDRVGASPSPISPPEFKTFIAAELQKWKDALQAAGISPE